MPNSSTPSIRGRWDARRIHWASSGFTAALNLGVSRGSVAVAISESPEAANHLSSQIETGLKVA